MASTVSPSSLRSRENDNTHHQPPDGDSHHGSVRPLHRRALETMPHDVHIPLPLSSIQYSKDEPNRMLNADGTTSLYLQDSNSNPLEKPHCRYGNDREEGYGDNNNSTQLSDVDTAFPTLHQAEQGDTIEDVMNIPGTKIVPAPVQDFNAFYPRDEPTPDETRQLRRRRGVIEAEIREQLLEQVDAHAITAAEGFTKEFTPQDDARDTKTEFDTADAVGAFQESSEPFHCGSSTPISHYLRRASEPSLTRITCTSAIQPIPHASLDLTANLSSDKPSTPLRRHNTTPPPPPPLSMRRKPAKPADEAEDTDAAYEAELHELEKYRDLDLAPLEPVMQCDNIAGDLITHGTPVKARDVQISVRRGECGFLGCRFGVNRIGRG